MPYKPWFYEKDKREKHQRLKKYAKIARKRNIITWSQLYACKLLDRMKLSYIKEYPVIIWEQLYIIDIYVTELKICIEIDWLVHEEEEQKLKDSERDNNLKNNWYWIARFKNNELKDNFYKRMKNIVNLREYYLNKN